jgi:hypothetical protein
MLIMQIFQDDIVKTKVLVNEINNKLSKRISELEDKVNILEKKLEEISKKI